MHTKESSILGKNSKTIYMTYMYMGPSSSSSIIKTPAVLSIYKVRLHEITQNEQGGIAVDCSSRGMLKE